MRIDRSRQRLLSRTTELRFHTRWLQSAIGIAQQITTKRQRIKTGFLRTGMPMFTAVNAYRIEATVAQITPPHAIRRIIACRTAQRLRCAATNACRQIARAPRSIEEHTAAAFELLRLTIDAAHKVIAIVVDGQIDETAAAVAVGRTAEARRLGWPDATLRRLIEYSASGRASAPNGRAVIEATEEGIALADIAIEEAGRTAATDGIRWSCDGRGDANGERHNCEM